VIWQGSDDVAPTTRIAAVGPSMQVSERRVASAIAENASLAVESTAQELADRVGVARSTVIRTCQSLGFSGYPQLRVALARELALQTQPATTDYGTSALGAIRASADAFGQGIPQLTALLTEDAVEHATGLILAADRVLAVANGLSGPLALDVAMRLTAVGRPAEYIGDPIAQQIAASRLTSGSTCLVISGSGSSRATLETARAAQRAGAGIVAITSFARSALVTLADVSLVVPPAGGTFRHELEHTSRVAHSLLIEALVDLVGVRLGAEGRAARQGVLEILGGSLGE